ncbi:MAG: YceD family protein [Brevibacterium sp.]
MKNRSEYVFDIRSMGLLGHPGEWERVNTTLSAPADLKIEVIGVAEGSPMTLELMFESVSEGIYVSGTVSAVARGEDVRTLEAIELPIDVDINEMYVYEQAEGDEDSYVIDRDQLDLEPAIRDAVVMALPFSPSEDRSEEFSYTVGEDLEVDDGESESPFASLQSLLDEKKES